MFIFVTRFFSYFMLFRLNFFDFFNFFFIIINLYLFIIVWFHVYYFLDWLLKVTLLIMLLNSENSNILYIFLFGSRLVSIILFLVFTLFNLLGNWLLLLNRWLLRLLILVVVVNHFVNFIFVVLIIFFSLISFITVRQWWVIQVSHSVVELALHSLVILVIWVYQTTDLTCKVRWSLKAWFISVDINRLVKLRILLMINITG